MKNLIITLALFTLSGSLFGMGSKRNEDLLTGDFKDVSKNALREFQIKGPRNLDFLDFENQKTAEVSIRKKQVEKITDKVFVDGHGREVYFRGWNISGRSKGKQYNFKPFADAASTKVEMKAYDKKTGSNIIRWLFSWSGGQPEVNKIDLKYFENQALLIKEAIKRGMYVLVDFHQDTFSGHIKGGANGAPKWVVDGMRLPGKYCGPTLEAFCASTWSVNYVVNKDVVDALEKFWDNMLIDTKVGKRHVQEEYVRMVSAGLAKIKEVLGDDFKYIIGLDPFNEPHYGGLPRRGKTKKWLNKKLFPFYHKIRAAMDKSGWENRLLFSEPHMMWNYRLPITTAFGSGTGLLKNPPKDDRWVFNSHFYDETRESVGYSPAYNGAYLKSFQKVREEARNWNMPPIISEFGTWKGQGGRLRQKASDASNNLKLNFQGMELAKTSKRSHRFADFYSSFISSIQWVWNSKDSGTQPKNPHALDRIYPRRVQGEMMTFHYNDTVRSSFDNRELNYIGVKPSGNKKGKTYFEKNRFGFMIWRGRKSDAPTELYIPGHLKLGKTLLITDKKIVKGLDKLSRASKDKSDEILLLRNEGAGSRLFIFDDIGEDENFHFALVVELDDLNSLNDEEIAQIHGQLIELIKRKNSPLYFLGKLKVDNPLIK